MIDELHVENLALIKDATLIPSKGMTVLTGETGAGKTALLSACRLMMGQRADKSMIREGELDATCEIRLFTPDADGLQEEIVATRKVSSDGRSRSKIDGSLASVSELAALIGPHIDLCSQHDQRLLMSSSVQRNLLDAWAGVQESGVMQKYTDAFALVCEKRKHLDELINLAQASDEKLEDAKRIFMQISALDPSEEDYEHIRLSLKKAENSEVLARSTGGAQRCLNDDGRALDSMNEAIVLLEEAGRVDDALAELAKTLREAIYIAEDVARDVSSYASSIELDLSELEFMQERMAAYQSVLRSFGPSLNDVLDAQNKASQIIDATEHTDKFIEDARCELEIAEEDLHACAEALDDARLAAAPTFADAVNSVLSKLKMQQAEILIEVEPLPRDSWTASGSDEVHMMFVPAEGMQPRELSRIASGGELSRVMLAIRAAMGNRDDVETLIFDEIDTGVGGESALALSEVLYELSKSHQVIVVSHLAQVASKADCHYLVKKISDSKTVQTHLIKIEGEDRVHEIARMLSGSVTGSSLAHARELLAR